MKCVISNTHASTVGPTCEKSINARQVEGLLISLTTLYQIQGTSTNNSLRFSTFFSIVTQNYELFSSVPLEFVTDWFNKRYIKKYLLNTVCDGPSAFTG